MFFTIELSTTPILHDGHFFVKTIHASSGVVTNAIVSSGRSEAAARAARARRRGAAAAAAAAAAIQDGNPSNVRSSMSKSSRPSASARRSASRRSM
jgi:hypothetical protein